MNRQKAIVMYSMIEAAVVMLLVVLFITKVIPLMAFLVLCVTLGVVSCIVLLQIIRKYQ